jgi:hypothetical protein
VLFLEAKWCLSDVFAEMLTERALVGEAALQGDLRKLAVPRLEHLTSGLDPHPHEERLGAHGEGFHEASVELAWGDANVLSEVFYRQLFSEPLTDTFHCTVDGEVGSEGVMGCAVALRCAHESDDGACAVAQGEFVRDEPVRQSLSVEEEFDDVELGFSGAHDFCVVFAEMSGELSGEEVVVVFSHDLAF